MTTPSKTITAIKALLTGTTALADIRVTDYSIGTKGKKITLKAADEFENVFEAIDGCVGGSNVVTTMTDAGLLTIRVKKDGAIKRGVLVDLATNEAQELSFGKKLISAQKVGTIEVSDKIRAMAKTFFDCTTEEDTTNGLTVSGKQINFIASPKIVKYMNKVASTKHFADIAVLLAEFDDDGPQSKTTAHVDQTAQQEAMPVE